MINFEKEMARVNVDIDDYNEWKKYNHELLGDHLEDAKQKIFILQEEFKQASALLGVDHYEMLTAVDTLKLDF